MLGLRVENDRQYSDQSRWNGNFKRNSKFARALRDRFFVSGISGRFQKQEDEEKEAATKIPRPRKYSYQPVLEKHQQMELQKEAAKLIELEEKLAEIQHLKEAKRQRDRMRRKRKLEYTSAFLIQTIYRRYHKRKYGCAVDTIIAFLKVMAAKQAICNAVWAISVLRKFAKLASSKWLSRKFYMQQVSCVAKEAWFLVKDVALIYSMSTKVVAEEFTGNTLLLGLCNSVGRAVAERAVQGKRLEGKGPRRSSRPSAPNQYLQFFLTEFDGEGERAEEDDSSQLSLEELQELSQGLSQLHKRGSSKYQGSQALAPLLKQSSRYWDELQRRGQGREKRKVYDFTQEQVRSLLLKHLRRMASMEEERKQRVRSLEKGKEKSKGEVDEGAEQKGVGRQRQVEYRKRLDEERKKKEEMVRKMREERDEKLRADREEERRERSKEVRGAREAMRRVCVEEGELAQHRTTSEEVVLLEEGEWKEVLIETERREGSLGHVNSTGKGIRERTPLPRAVSQGVGRAEGEMGKREEKAGEAGQKRPPVPRFPHPPKGKGGGEEKKSGGELEKGRGMTEKELEEHRERLRERLKQRLRHQEEQLNGEKAKLRERQEKVKRVLALHREQMEREKEEKRRKKRERERKRERKTNQELSPSHLQGEEEVEEEEEEEEERGESLLHIISSGAEQADNLMQDFQFEDFLNGEDLQVVYTAPPAAPASLSSSLSNPPHIAPPSNEEERRRAWGRALSRKVQGRRKKKEEAREKKAPRPIPSQLQQTPYFGDYSKLVGAGLTSVHDLRRREFLSLADSHFQPLASPAPPAPFASAGSALEREGREKEGEDVDGEGGLRELLKRARSLQIGDKKGEDRRQGEREVEVEGKVERSITSGLLEERQKERVNLEQVLNFHLFRAPPTLPPPLPSPAVIGGAAEKETGVREKKGRGNKKEGKGEAKPSSLSKASTRYASLGSVADGEEEERSGGEGRRAVENGEDEDKKDLSAAPLPPHVKRRGSKAKPPLSTPLPPSGATKEVRGASHLRKRLEAFQSYEEQLLRDYASLRESFSLKLAKAAQAFSLPHEERNAKETEEGEQAKEREQQGGSGPAGLIEKYLQGAEGGLTTRALCSSLSIQEEAGDEKGEEEGREEEEEQGYGLRRGEKEVDDGYCHHLLQVLNGKLGGHRNE